MQQSGLHILAFISLVVSAPFLARADGPSCASVQRPLPRAVESLVCSQPDVWRAQQVSLDYEDGGFRGWNAKRMIANGYSAVVRERLQVEQELNLGHDQLLNAPKESKVVQFELRQGDAVRANDGYRTELKENYYTLPNELTIYEFELLIPEDYPTNEDDEDKRFCILGQWHNAVGPEQPIGREPFFANYYINGELRIYIKSLMSPTSYPSSAAYQKALSRANDPWDKGDLLYARPGLEKNKWHKLVYLAKWRNDPTGELKIWLNDELIVSYQGPMGNADELRGAYFKYGVYCKHNVSAPHRAIFGAYRRTSLTPK